MKCKDCAELDSNKININDIGKSYYCHVRRQYVYPLDDACIKFKDVRGI